MTDATALIVDDERDIRELLGLALGRMGLKVSSADSLQQAIACLAEHPFDLCLTDMRLPDGDGIALIRHLSAHYPQTPVAMITAYGDVQSAVAALKAGAYDFVSKPVDLAELRQIVQHGLLLRATPPSAAHESAQALPEAVERLERLQIQNALELCRHNKTKAAAHLGITFRALRYKMQKLGLE